MNTEHPIAILSDTKYLSGASESKAETQANANTNAITKKQIRELYRKTNWRTSTQTRTLKQIVNSPELLVIRTDHLTVIDFDDDATFKRALDYNEHLAPQNKCNFIVQSSRKGGHFYFSPNKDIPEPIGHSKQPIFDYLSGPGHNVIAPSHGDRGKTIITKLTNTDYTLNTYSQPWDMFLQVVIAHNVDSQKLTLISTQVEGHSDDNSDFVKLYLSNTISQEAFDTFYNIPSPIPQGMSNKYYLQLSTRLGCDETISWEDYSQTIIKFNLHHQRKTPQELAHEIMERMKPTGDEVSTTSQNGLWKYNPDKSRQTLSFTHRTLKTTVHPYYDINTGEYLISYQDSNAQHQLIVRRTRAQYLDIMEKLVTNAQATKKTEKVPVVHSVQDYSQPFGYNPDSQTFNKAIVGPELAAFYGTKPHNYTYPTKLLEVCKYMWGEEMEYLLSATKFRYTTFKFSPVITFLQGTEGSGKDLTVSLLTKPFPHHAQQLNAQLVKDVHSNWQTEPNAIVSELGDWRAMDKENLLATLKTISGSQGIVTYRGMQQTAVTTQSLIKIWVTGNNWVKLHNDPLSQRRIYPVYMPRPLSKIMGGPYTEQELRNTFSAENILNFYYYLGNEYPHSITLDEYMTPQSRKQSESYQLYKEATESKPDVVSELLWKREWPQFEKALTLYELTLNDLEWKFNRAKNLVVTVESLKRAFREGGAIIEKTIDRLKTDKEGNKRLKFSGSNVENYITIYSAPDYLESGLNVSNLEEDNIS